MGKSFSDIGISSHFLISEIRITDIVNSNFRYQKIEFLMLENHLVLLISEYHPIYRYGKFEPISVIQSDFAILVNQLINRYQKFDLPISEIRSYFPISVNQLIFRYRKFTLPISVIQHYFPIWVNQLSY